MNYYVSLIIRNHDGRFLCLHCFTKKEHKWRFPAGKLEPGETLIGAAARELKEETGVDALNLKFYGVYSDLMDGSVWTGYYFVCDRYHGTPHIQEPEKHNVLTWMNYYELLMAGAAATELTITRAIELAEPVSGYFELPTLEDDSTKDLWAV